MSAQQHNIPEDDEAMEWITDWDYERILPNNEHYHSPHGATAMEDHHHHDDDDVEMMDEDDVDPLPLDSEHVNHSESDSKEISIFWTRVSEDMTDEDFHGMFNFDSRNSFSGPTSRRNSRNSLNWMDSSLLPSSIGASATEPSVDPHTSDNQAEVTLPLKVHSNDATESYNVGDDDESIMSPLQEKEGLLPPMSPSQLYHQSNAQYGMIKSSPKYNHPPHQDTTKAHHAHSGSSVATHTTTDMMDEETISSASVAAMHNSNGDIYERQQQLLQEVLQEAPQRNQSRRSSYELPQPDHHQQMLMQEMRQHNGGPPTETRKRPAIDSSSKSGGTVPDKSSREPPAEAASDPIFARQQEIFHQMRGPEKSSTNKHTHSGYPAHHHQHHYPPQKHQSVTTSSPVSVTKTLTRAGMDSEEYQKVVTRLTEKNLMERQRAMLQESMKRSLETRQALHIKPTALPDYNHDKLSQVLKDIESSSRNISATYGR